MRLPKDILFGVYTKPRLFLCETDKSRICQLETTNTSAALKFNAYSELSFDIARVYNNLATGETKINPFYSKIEAVRLIELEGFGYFELQGPELTSNGIEEKKVCTAYGLEYTLSQKYLEDFHVNTGTAQSLEVINAASEKDIVPITLYNSTNPKLSLLHLVLSEIYGWRIGHVDASLQTLSRQFEVDRESVYDFLMNEVCEKFNCYIVFDTINNTINVYAESLTAKFIGDGSTNSFIITPPFSQINTVSVDGYKTTRWEYNTTTGEVKLEDTPASGARIEIIDGALTEWETDVFVTFDNLSQEININYDADTIKTRLTVTYGDDYDIREVNLGLPYLTDLSYYYTVDWMGQDLYDAYTKYLQKSNASQSEYANNSQEILKFNDCIAYEENRLSLEYSLVASVNSQTVGTYYTRQENTEGSYYYSEVSLPSEYKANVDYYSNVTTNLNEEKVSDLYEVLKKYFYAFFNKLDDKKTEALDELNELADAFKFMTEHTIAWLHGGLQNVSNITVIDSMIAQFLDEMWYEVGRTPLKQLYLDPYKQIQETNIKAGWSKSDNENYGYYYPVVLFINSIEIAIAERDKKISNYEHQKGAFQQANANISDGLLMRNNFTEGQLVRLSAFIREDELHLDDIIETSQDNLSSSFKVKQDAMESGRIELQKLCQPQLQFSMTMANIYALPEFEPIIHQFQLGKVIKVCLRPDYVKQSRLLQVNINFDDFADFSCEFGELTSLRTQSDIHADLLSQAITAGKSVATNSSYWTRGSDIATSTDLKIQQGLLDATTQIKAMDGSQGVVIDKYGIHLTKMDPTTGEVDPHQTWMTNNMILMSDDGFKTSRSALGEITVDGEIYYGLIAEMVLSGYIEGSIIQGGIIKGSTIQIGEYTDENGNKKHAFEVDKDGNVTMNATNKIEGYSTTAQMNSAIDAKASEITLSVDKVENTLKNDYSTTTEMNAAIEVRAQEIVSEVETKIGEGHEELSSRITQNATSITSEVTRATNAEGELSSRITQTEKDITLKVSNSEIISTINQSAEEIKINASKITLEGVVTANEHFKILSDGSMEAAAGNIAGWNIKSNYLGTLTSPGSTFFLSQTGQDAYWNEEVGNLSWFIYAGQKFGVTDAGKMYATDADVTGKITASSGKIGGWVIGTTYIGSTLDKGSFYIASADDGLGYWVRAQGSDNIITFSVSNEGTLYARNADIGGKITADSGQIGSWDIKSDYLGTFGAVGTTYFLSQSGKTAWVSAAPDLGDGNEHYRNCLMYLTGKFAVDTSGNLYSTAGYIGGWEINSDYLGYYTTSGTGSNEFFLSRNGKSVYVPVAGATINCLCNFGGKFAVNTAGKLYAEDAVIKGTITATRGTIGGFPINEAGTGLEKSVVTTESGVTVADTTIVDPGEISVSHVISIDEGYGAYDYSTLKTVLRGGLLQISVSAAEMSSGPLSFMTVSIQGTVYEIYIDSASNTLKARKLSAA